MATIKQIEAIQKLASIVGKTYTEKELAPLGNGALDEIFNELRAALKEKKVTEKTEKTEKKSVINPIRFGLACKLVIEKSNINWVLSEPQEFKERVFNLYNLMTEAEAEYSASLRFIQYYKKNPVTRQDIQRSVAKKYDRDTMDARYEDQYKQFLEEGYFDSPSDTG